MERLKLICETEGCTEQAPIHVFWAEQRRSGSEKHYCEQHVKQLEYFRTEGIGKGRSASLSGARCFDIEVLFITENDDVNAIYLHEVGGPRVISIGIGIFEATSIARQLQQLQTPRPLTHAVMLNAIRELGGQVEDVVIHKYEDHTYFADLRVRQNGRIRLLDMRPSDAITVALIADCPMFLTEDLLAQIDAECVIP